MNFRCNSESRVFASSIFLYSRLQFIVNKNKKTNLVVMDVCQANKANMKKSFFVPLISNVSNPINEITIVQYGKSMIFCNKLGGIWIIKVLDKGYHFWG